MGLDVYTYLRIAVPLTPDELVRSVSTKVVCEKGHKKTGKTPFCGQDGTKFGKKTVSKPLPGFLRYCKEQDCDPDPQEVFSDDFGSGFILWGNIQPVDSGEDRHPKTHLVRNVLTLGSYRPSHSNQIDWDEVTRGRGELEDFVERLIGERRPSGVYLCMYYSY
jgi:hypothetical protein